MAKIQFGLNLEFRNPRQFYRDPAKLYADIIDHAVWAESLGYDYIFLTEHHFTADDWAPSPLMLLSAIAARTKRVRLSTSIMLLPFYHPVRLAEDGAVLDIISGGRYELAAGLGYRPRSSAAMAWSCSHAAGAPMRCWKSSAACGTVRPSTSRANSSRWKTRA